MRYPNKNVKLYYFLFSTILMLIAFTILIYHDLEKAEFSKRTPLEFVLGVAVALALFVLLIRYLNVDDKIEETKHWMESIKFRKTQKDLYNHYKKQADKTVAEFINSSTKIEEIEKAVYNKIIDNFEDNIVNGVESRYKKYIEFDLKYRHLVSKLDPIVNGTQRYIYKLKRDLSINLGIGIFSSGIAIYVLVQTILHPIIDLKDWSVFGMYFIPRISFAVFIQLFAFFFLRLYKNNLEDVKYFQNEITNLHSKSAALQMAILLEKDALVEKLINDLSGTERNFKLLPGESMHMIERAKIEKDVDINMIEAFKDFLKVYKKEN